nr:hypothetical protein [Paracoccus alkanivorans]
MAELLSPKVNFGIGGAAQRDDPQHGAMAFGYDNSKEPVSDGAGPKFPLFEVNGLRLQKRGKVPVKTGHFVEVDAVFLAVRSVFLVIPRISHRWVTSSFRRIKVVTLIRRFKNKSNFFYFCERRVKAAT